MPVLNGAKPSPHCGGSSYVGSWHFVSGRPWRSCDPYLYWQSSLDASPAPSTSFSRSLPARPTTVNEPRLRTSVPGGLLSNVTVKSRWFRLLTSFRLCVCTERFDCRSECTSRVSLVECTATNRKLSTKKPFFPSFRSKRTGSALPLSVLNKSRTCSLYITVQLQFTLTSWCSSLLCFANSFKGIRRSKPALSSTDSFASGDCEGCPIFC